MTSTAQSALSATVLITTKDRRDMLGKAIRSVLEQTARPEILVVDDGSIDGTSDFVASKFPQVRLVRNPKPLGIIAARNTAIGLIETPILFTLDDDAVFTSPDTVERALAHFNHERVGVVSIPHINFLQAGQFHKNACSWAANDDFPCSASYSGGTNAKRVDLFRELGGYRGTGRQGEEMTYSLRLLDAGYVVRIANVPPIHHFPLAFDRDESEIVSLGARNSVVFAWQHSPSAWLPIHLLGTIWSHLSHGRKTNQFRAAQSGILSGFKSFLKEERAPVSRKAYALYRRMRRRGPMPYSKIAPTLAALSNKRA